jgi:hypothetical protein
MEIRDMTMEIMDVTNTTTRAIREITIAKL